MLDSQKLVRWLNYGPSSLPPPKKKRRNIKWAIWFLFHLVWVNFKKVKKAFPDTTVWMTWRSGSAERFIIYHQQNWCPKLWKQWLYWVEWWHSIHKSEIWGSLHGKLWGFPCIVQTQHALPWSGSHMAFLASKFQSNIQ